MRNHFIYFYCSLACCFLFHNSLPAQQLKLGNHPSLNRRSAVLELESPDQGLLLSRVADTDKINTYSPPEGMIIYFTDGKTAEPYGANAGLFERIGGAWRNVKTRIDTAVDHSQSAIKFTRENGKLVLHLPNATSGLRGVVSGGRQSFSGRKTFNDSVRIKNLHAGSVVFIRGGPDTLDHVLTEDSAHLFWDNTDDRLGIGTHQPSATLDVHGNFKLGGGSSVLQAIIHVEYNTPATENISVGGAYLYDVPAAGVTAGASVLVSPQEELPDGLIIAYGFTSNGAAHIKIINTGSAAVNVAAGTEFNMIIIQ